jgi:hypothetical protein
MATRAILWESGGIPVGQQSATSGQNGASIGAIVGGIFGMEIEKPAD